MTREPDVETDPTFGEMYADVAFVELHVSVR